MLGLVSLRLFCRFLFGFLLDLLVWGKLKGLLRLRFTMFRLLKSELGSDFH